MIERQNYDQCWVEDAEILTSKIVHNTKLPVPHIEHPKDNEQYPLRISFLDQQTVQTAHVVFMTQLSYKFENWQVMRPYTLVICLDHANRE